MITLNDLLKFMTLINNTQTALANVYSGLNEDTTAISDELKQGTDSIYPIDMANEILNGYIKAENQRNHIIATSVKSMWIVIEDIIIEDRGKRERLRAFDDATTFAIKESDKLNILFEDVAEPYYNMLHSVTDETSEWADGVPLTDCIDMMASLGRLSENNLRVTLGCLNRITKAYTEIETNEYKKEEQTMDVEH